MGRKGKAGGWTRGRDGEAVRLVAENRKARHDYEILEELEAGLELRGSEVKSLRGGKGNIAEGFVLFEEGEAWLLDVHIPPYAQAGPYHNHEPRRRRRLLLKRRELDRWAKKVRERGLTVVPLRLYFRGAWVKVTLGLVRGRKLHDKRDRLKEKDAQRQVRDQLRDGR